MNNPINIADFNLYTHNPQSDICVCMFVRVSMGCLPDNNSARSASKYYQMIMMNHTFLTSTYWSDRYLCNKIATKFRIRMSIYFFNV